MTLSSIEIHCRIFDLKMKSTNSCRAMINAYLRFLGNFEENKLS